MVFSLLVLTSLALIKRFSELSMRQGEGLADPSNRDYRISDLQIIAAMAAASAMNAVTVFALYVLSSAVTPLYSRPWMLWLLAPLLLLYWFGRALMIAHRREMADDPSSTLSGTARAAPPWRRWSASCWRQSLSCPHPALAQAPGSGYIAGHPISL